MKLIVIFVAIIYICSMSEAADENYQNFAQCDGTDLRFEHRFIAIRSQCRAKYYGEKAKSDDSEKKMHYSNAPRKRSNMACFIVCEFQGLDLISKDGTISKANIAPFIANLFPASVTETLSDSIAECVDENVGSVAITGNENCNSYKPFIKCVRKAIFVACKWKKD